MPPEASDSGGKEMSIHQKARLLGELIVQSHPDRLRLGGLPVDAGGTGAMSARVYRLDQRAADARAARRLGREQVLQVTHRAERDRAAVIKKVRQAEQFAVTFCNQRMYRLIGIEESRPGHRGDFGCERGIA